MAYSDPGGSTRASTARRTASIAAVEALAWALMKVDPVHPTPTGWVSPELLALKTGSANLWIMKADDAVICFDAGMGTEVVRREFDRVGLDPLSVTHLFLTHTDVDHVAGVSVMARAQIFISTDEEQMIWRVTPRHWPFYYNKRLPRPYTLLADNEEITVGPFTVRAIATPGHTPGSMSFLVNDTTLFVGDACRMVHGIVEPIQHIFTMDKGTQLKSIRKFAAIDGVTRLATAHRGFTDDINRALGPWRPPR